jgi:nicotinamide mononucleotide transporter
VKAVIPGSLFIYFYRMDTPATIWQTFIDSVQRANLFEWIAVITGIISVWLSKRENILVYPVGLVNTMIYSYLSLQAHLAGEAAVNVYYTIMNVYGWYLWSRKYEASKRPVWNIRFNNAAEQRQSIAFFLILYVALFAALTYMKKAFWPGAIPWADALASAAAFTAMWLMARKKVESWIYWIITNIVSIPLYFVKDMSLTSVYYFILLIMAFFGWYSWKQKALRDTTHV